jgi:hypothetical protein
MYDARFLLSVDFGAEFLVLLPFWNNPPAGRISFNLNGI